MVTPIYKKGEQERTGNYRGISLLCTAYKVYAEVLRRRLEEEMEEIGILQESQAGFRRGRGTLDNIFVLNHIIQRDRMAKESKKIYALFVDLRAAFDNVDRGKLWDILKEDGINMQLIGRIEGVYEEHILQ